MLRIVLPFRQYHGNLRKRNLAISELKVHNRELGSSICICQNAFGASSFAHTNRDIISLRVGSLKCSRRIALFKYRGSTQTRCSSLALCTTISEFTHFIGSSVFTITFMSYIFCNFAFSSSYNAHGYFRHGSITGTASSLSLILTFPGK